MRDTWLNVIKCCFILWRFWVLIFKQRLIIQRVCSCCCFFVVVFPLLQMTVWYLKVCYNAFLSLPLKLTLLFSDILAHAVGKT